MIESLYPYLIVAGATMLGVLFHLWRRAQKFGQTNLELVLLNKSLNFDALALLRQAWPLLQRQGLQGFSWRAHWFGYDLNAQHGDTRLPGREEKLVVGDVTLCLTFHHARGRGENRMFDEAAEENFLLLLLTDLWIKAGSIDASFKHLSRLSLFLEHDMKNIAQFVQFSCDQLAVLQAGQEASFLARLKLALPSVRQRADHIVNTLTGTHAPSAPAGRLALHDEICRLCEIYGLPMTLEGQAWVQAEPSRLDCILDNLIKNYVDLGVPEATTPPLSVTLRETAGQVEMAFCDHRLFPGLPSERLFEPFWSTREQGLGIGLYQAREAASALGGDLRCVMADDRLTFCLTLPDCCVQAGTRSASTL